MNLQKNEVFEKEEGEDIKIVLRRHWACMINLVLFVFIMTILPVIIYSILRNYIFLSEGFFNIFILGAGIYYMFVATLFFIGWLDYYLDIAIITNERIIDIDQNSLFDRDVAELHLSKIQDVSAEVTGIMPTMLDFGNVKIQTAGAQEEFIIDNVPHPYKVDKLITDMQQAYIKSLNGNNGNNAGKVIDQIDGI